ncbi:hypothetical protein STEG23_034247 [Scotinomys teguina]
MKRTCGDKKDILRRRPVEHSGGSKSSVLSIHLIQGQGKTVLHLVVDRRRARLPHCLLLQKAVGRNADCHPAAQYRAALLHHSPVMVQTMPLTPISTAVMHGAELDPSGPSPDSPAPKEASEFVFCDLTFGGRVYSMGFYPAAGLQQALTSSSFSEICMEYLQYDRPFLCLYQVIETVANYNRSDNIGNAVAKASAKATSQTGCVASSWSINECQS